IVKPVASALLLASGNGQSGVANTELEQPFVARVMAADGLGVPAAFVRFQIASGGGQLVDTVVTSDADGFVRTRLKVGTVAGPSTVTAIMSNAGGAPYIGPPVCGSPHTLA